MKESRKVRRFLVYLKVVFETLKKITGMSNLNLSSFSRSWFSFFLAVIVLWYI